MRQASLFELGERIAGVDEAGRGPLAGPVVAAAVILGQDQSLAGLADSKKLTAGQRVEQAASIREQALAVGVAWADAAEIDALNILGATMIAMRRAVLNLPVLPSGVQVDGNRLPDLHFGDRLLPGEAIVGGDARVAAISAASIIAKVTRDSIMTDMDRLYPEYGFARHKGYPTDMHRAQLRSIGPCVQHRRSFAPVRACA